MPEIHGQVYSRLRTWCDLIICDNTHLLIAETFDDITCKECKTQILRNI